MWCSVVVWFGWVAGWWCLMRLWWCVVVDWGGELMREVAGPVDLWYEGVGVLLINMCGLVQLLWNRHFWVIMIVAIESKRVIVYLIITDMNVLQRDNSQPVSPLRVASVLHVPGYREDLLWGQELFWRWLQYYLVGCFEGHRVCFAQRQCVQGAVLGVLWRIIYD